MIITLNHTHHFFFYNFNHCFLIIFWRWKASFWISFWLQTNVTSFTARRVPSPNALFCTTWGTILDFMPFWHFFWPFLCFSARPPVSGVLCEALPALCHPFHGYCTASPISWLKDSLSIDGKTYNHLSAPKYKFVPSNKNLQIKIKLSDVKIRSDLALANFTGSFDLSDKFYGGS